MTDKAQHTLLSAADPLPVRITNRGGSSLFLVLGDHAGNCVPQSLVDLGLDEADLGRHIALDIGVSALGRALAASLDAVFVEQRFSRLVIDCNRAKGVADSIPKESDATQIPMNAIISREDRERRHAEIFVPYHRAIEALLRERAEQDAATILVSLHSFTPALAGVIRPWDVGVLYDGGDTSFAIAVLHQLQMSRRGMIGDNQPYVMDATDFTIPFHAYARRLPYVELEIRQDHLGSAEGVAKIAEILAEALITASALFHP